MWIVTGGVTAAQGFRATGIAAGIKKQGKDLGLIVSEQVAHAAGVFTCNRVRAACVDINRETIHQEGLLQAIIVNSGNANACNGDRGWLDTTSMQELTANGLGISKQHVAVASTGVVGVPMPIEKVEAAIPHLIDHLGDDGDDFATAILTTDTCKKEIAVQFEIQGVPVTIGGVAKGSGMIHPNMATMLSFITTDASVDQGALQRALVSVTDRTFNRITVDGDTSTNDMVLLMANGMSGCSQLDESHSGWAMFLQGLETVALHLAKAIARDGEGATRLVQVEVTGASNQAQAATIAKSVVGSSLVKTAVFGADANWGRILVAMGYAGVDFDPEKVEIRLGEILMAEKGAGVPFDEELATDYLQQDPVMIHVNLHQGDASATAYGCDLTYDYVRINASYRS